MSQTVTGTMKDPKGKSVAALMTALMAAVFAFQLNASMLSPALTTMQNELNTTSSQIGLTQTVFFTACAVFSLFLPRLGDLAGRKKVLLGMLVLTAIGCVISALAVNVPMLMVGRVVQGVAGPIVPMTLIMLHHEVTDDTRYAKLMSILTAVNGGIGGVDAILGGWLAGTFGFRSVFWFMVVIAVIAIVLVFIFASESHAAETPRMDWPGVVSLCVAFLMTYLAINEIEKLAEANWMMVAGEIVVAAIFFVVFWQIEKRAKAPMVTTHYLKQRRTWGLLLTTLLTMTGVFAIMNGIVPALAQDAKFGAGISASVVSFATLTPYALIGLAFGPVAGVLASKFGYHKVLRMGLLVTVLGLLFGIYVCKAPSVWALVVLSLVLGVSYAGTVNIMLNGLGVVLSPADNTGYLPGLNSGGFNLGAGLSYAVLYAFMNAFTSSGNGTTGYVASMIGAVALLALAYAASLLIPKHADD
ncbi:major facilitator superfamily MFS_1 [Bifidobacterium actinocoloniiforme DSM 22766]|uniref:Major facilitator superfamily MFS_1 n=2 Tax=Bifidobacterium actinocoloniiforme TaxID=638619 RepID=A0A086Z1L5_9BIFI|nr:MFS transporter [Bifidobacterium actinocoloniiforme]AKV55545.1 multidrug ABC transporter [Bifidobacterium actinocoloniiforme DSM 22766]KFI40415.1 major facilitator superfamily MFS_1 [Bifidobacterium actinocoloniiforme DSM 22766]